jgi:replicative DNA helicase
MIIDQSLPHDLCAEESLLSACLLDKESLQEAMDTLIPDDFYSTINQKIFKAMAETASADPSVGAEFAAVAAKARDAGNLPDTNQGVGQI